MFDPGKVRARILQVLLTISFLTSAQHLSAEEVVIDAGRLIDGVGSEIRKEVPIQIQTGRNRAIVPGYIEESDAPIIDLSDATVLPGFHRRSHASAWCQK